MSELKALAVHGDAFVYRSCNGTVLVDGGGSSATLGKQLATALPGLSHLDIVVCTHADLDHANGLKSILTHWRSARRGTATIGEFWLPGRWMDVVKRGLTDPKKLMSKLIGELDEGRLEDARAVMWTEANDDAGGSFEDDEGSEIPPPTLSETIEALRKSGSRIQMEDVSRPKSEDEAAWTITVQVDAGPRPDPEQVDDEDRSQNYMEPFEPEWLGELRARLADLPEDGKATLAFKNARRRVDYRIARYQHMVARGLPRRVGTSRTTARYCLALIDAAEAIVKIARHAISNHVPIRWFDQDLYLEKHRAQGGRPGLLLPMNAVELRAVPTAVAPSMVFLTLSKANRESLAFYAPADAGCRGVVFCADSRLGTGLAGATPFQSYRSMSTSDQVGTAPHHAAESAASAYAIAPKFGIIDWVCAANGRTVPGPTFRKIANSHRCCTGCRRLPKDVATVTIDLKAVGFALPKGCLCR
jgi:hypothetical protein